MSFKRRLAVCDPSVKTTIQRVKAGVLQPYLHINDIAELWAEGTNFSNEGYLKLIREEIQDGYLACMTLGQWIEENEKETKLFSKPRPPKIIPRPPQGVGIKATLGALSFVAYGTSSSDRVPEDRIGGYLGDTSGMSADEKQKIIRLYMVNRVEFKKWLQKNEEWPLPNECLLARWWDGDEGDEEANTIQIAARKQQKEKALQVLIDRVVEKNPTYKTVDVWNNLNKYDNDEIILEQEPKKIESLTGNENATIAYLDPVTAKIYKPISLKAFQERYSKARKKIKNNGK